jgi:hypothetical protein
VLSVGECKDADMDEVLKKVYLKLLAQICAPIFKEMGFKKSSVHFFRKTEELFQTFNFQKFDASSQKRSEINFTGNIGLIDPETYYKLNRVDFMPSFPKCTDALIQLRMGVITHGGDHWYRLSLISDLVALEENLRIDLEIVQRFFETHRTIDSLTGFCKCTACFNPYWAQIGQAALLMKLGKVETATDILKKTYAEALKPKSWVNITQVLNGASTTTSSTPEVNPFWLERVNAVAKTYNIILSTEENKEWCLKDQI